MIKDELDRRDEREINSVQALLLFNVGDQELTAGELRTRGHYLGSNVSYNLKKLVEGGYIHHERSEADRRSVLVRLTRKGEAVRDMLRELFDRHLGSLEAVGNVGADDLESLNMTLKRLERFWIDQVRFRLSTAAADSASVWPHDEGLRPAFSRHLRFYIALACGAGRPSGRLRRWDCRAAAGRRRCLLSRLPGAAAR